jgi:HD-GYP domain-containing protein (c-di-GMP phosphodiesterase class II)
MTPDQAIAELRRCSGSQFDPDIVEKLISVLKQEDKAPQLQENA